LRPSAATKDYVEPRQPPLDDAARDAFLARVREAATVMSGAEFSAPYEGTVVTITPTASVGSTRSTR
jgi:hypothetical protein